MFVGMKVPQFGAPPPPVHAYVPEMVMLLVGPVGPYVVRPVLLIETVTGSNWVDAVNPVHVWRKAQSDLL